MAGSNARGPGPLEVIAAEPASNVDDFADEVEPGDDAALHGAGVERVGVDAAGGDLGFGVAFGADGDDAPSVEAALEPGQGGVGERAGLGVGWMGAGMEGTPAVGEAAGNDGAEGLRGGGEVTTRVGLKQRSEDAERCRVSGEFEAGGQVE